MIRPQRGKLHIAPIRLPWKKHTHRTWVMVFIEHVEARYYELPDPNLNLTGFETEHDKLMQQAFDAITQATSSPEAKAALEQLHARHPYTMIGIHYDDKETMFDMKIPSSASQS